MDFKRRINKALRRLVLGGTDLPQACDISLDSPQIEIKVSLRGRAFFRDVTHSHSVACAAPFTFCVGLECSEISEPTIGEYFTLEFRQNRDPGKVLGIITLELRRKLPSEDHW